MHVLPALAVATSSDAPVEERFLASGSWRYSARWKAMAKINPSWATRWSRARRSAAWERVEQVCSSGRHNCAGRDVYQWGVYLGDSMALLSERMRQRGVPFRRMWGFDSFAGLPPEEAHSSGVYAKRLRSGDYQRGQYSTSDALDVYSVRALEASLSRRVNDTRVGWVAGFFNESLTPQLARKMAPALLVDADADLYSSTVQSLGWMCAHHLLVSGSLVYYDDWGAGGSHGQQRAHQEIASAYNITFQQVPVIATMPMDNGRPIRLAGRVAVFEVLTTPWSLLPGPALAVKA